MKELNDRIKELENQLAQAKIRSLEYQMKPHFLFNTLNLVARLISLGENSESLKVVYALSKLMRYCIEKKELVRVRDELQYINNYMFIQNYRNKQLYYQIDVSQTILSCLIPALSLQILAENSIKHGLEPKGGGTIKIIGRLKEQKVLLQVIDDGVGFPKSEAGSYQPSIKQQAMSKETGLINTEKRIKYYFGNEYGLSINTECRTGTTVSIIVPFRLDIGDTFVPVFWFD